MKQDMKNQVHIIGSGLAGAEDAGRNSLKNIDRNTWNPANVAGTSDYFSAESVPPLTGPEWSALLAIFAATLIMIFAARTVHHLDLHCRPGDVTTTNGREVCKASGANTSGNNNR